MQSLKELYDKYKGAVFGYLYRMTGTADEAEELTQETFYQAVLSLHRFRGDASLLTYLLRIGRNCYLKSLRHRQREVLAYQPERMMAELPDAGAPPLEHRLLQAEEEATLQRALERLPEQYRTALILREVQGLTHAEVALILGKSEPTVRVLIHRARQRLHQLYLREEESL